MSSSRLHVSAQVQIRLRNPSRTELLGFKASGFRFLLHPASAVT